VQAVDTFAKAGLRTLVYATREMSMAEWTAWIDAFTDRTRPASDLESDLESSLTLLGCTAVEDRLSPGVPEAIEVLQLANIRVWILTGDRMDTAVNVAVACRLHKPEQQKLVVQGTGELETMLRGVRSYSTKAYALVVDGQTLDRILASARHTETFMSLAMSCSNVLCCRTSPLQKAELTRHLQMSSGGALCLAIGDGANDVGMIQAAAVGVGIAGREGRQAARSADISLPRFSHLPRLLLVHGSWSYTRMAKTIVYCSYKNLLIVSCQFWYALVCAGSGQTAFESWMLTLSNALFTSWLPIVIGVTDQHLAAGWLMAHPQLYARGQRNAALTPARFWKAALNAVSQSAGLLLILALVMGGDPILADGSNGGMWVFSSTYYACALLTILYKAALLIASWNLLTLAIFLFGVLSWVAYVLTADFIALHYPITGSPIYNLSSILFSYKLFWLLVLLAPLLVLTRDFAWKYVKRLYLPREYHIVQELELLSRSNVEEEEGKRLEAVMHPSASLSTGSFAQVLMEQPHVPYGFAFSQTEGQTELIRR